MSFLTLQNVYFYPFLIFFPKLSIELQRFNAEYSNIMWLRHHRLDPPSPLRNHV